MKLLPLEAEDICTISIPQTVKSLLKNLPVTITDMVHKRDGVCYKPCNRHGHLAGTFSRSELLVYLIVFLPLCNRFKFVYLTR